ncbi:MAG: hypothetical protein QOH53_588, partial [Ilumatobacteraceae bacterium]
MSGGRTLATVCTIATVLALASCNDSDSSAGSSVASSVVATSTTVAATSTVETTTTAAPTTTAPTTAPASTIVAPTTAPTTAPVSTACPTRTPLPRAATNLVGISGDIDGDTLNDVVTSYTLDGVPHVQATLATGGESDVEVPIGFADTVSIQFMDFDHALGAAVPPPVAVLAIGATKAGTAVGAFLTLTPKYCIRVWHNNTTDDTLFTFRISAEPIYEGLQCDGAAGSINHSLSTAVQNPGGDWAVTLQPFGHNFTTVELHPVQNITVPDDPDIQHEYGDLTSC